MELPFPIAEALEGRARLLVPDVPRRKGPLPRGPWPFYNPTMALGRDVSAMVLARWPHPIRATLDGLAATGAWGIRMALEADAGGLVFNDGSPVAADLVRANVERNGLEAQVVSEDLRRLLAFQSFDFVDVDPFGPPTPFLDVALRGARVPSGLGVTATDTAPLSGTYPAVCLRRYGARPLRGPQGHEIGLRILIAYCASRAAHYDKAIRPLVAFSAEHFLRLHLLVEPAAGLPPLGVVSRREDGAFVPSSAADPTAVGPLWLGPLGDAAFLRRLAPSDVTRARAAALVERLREEADMPPFFASTDELARAHRGSPPKVERLLAALRDAGFRASRTHFDPRGVKTDAPWEEVLRLFRASMPSGPTDG